MDIITKVLVKFLLVFASKVIPGFSLLEFHDLDFYSLLDMYCFEMGPPLRRRKGRSLYVGHTFVAPYQKSKLYVTTNGQSGSMF
jgi:hypothetical protein